MGKEAKIGVAFIAVLLIIFGVVLANKFSGPDESDEQAAGEMDDGDESDSDNGSDSGNATVVSIGGIGEQPPDRTAIDDADWEYVDPLRTSGASDPPSMGPDPNYGMPRESSTAATGGMGNASQPPLPEGYVPGESTAPDPNGYPYNHPLRSPASAGSTASSPNPVRMPPPPTRPMQDLDPGASGATGYPPGTSTAGSPAPLPYSSADTHSPDSSVDYPSGQTADYPSRYSPQYTQQTNPTYSHQHVSQYGPAYGANASTAPAGEYEVQPNDSYWVISEKLYGTGSYFRALAEHNRSRVAREDRLDLGDVILTPPVEELERTYADLCPKPERRETILRRATTVSTSNVYSTGPTYLVEEGDTLFDIAKHELGDSTRWVEIYNLNRNMLGKDYNYLTPGLELSMPGNAPGDTLTLRPEPTVTYRQ